MTSWRTLSSTLTASSASNVAITLCPPPSRIARKYSLIRNSSSTVKTNIKSKQLFDNFGPHYSFYGGGLLGASPAGVARKAPSSSGGALMKFRDGGCELAPH